MSGTRIAIVHDWLDTWGGGESVLAEMLQAYPDCDLYALVDFMPDALRERLHGRHARTTFLQRMPGARRRFRLMLPLFPRAIESLDVSGYDLILSSSHAVAKGVRTRGDQLHICYCHTPMRYAWDLRDEYLRQSGLATGLRGIAVNRVLDRLRDWDRRTSGRVTHFIANSAFVRDRIARCYGRTATVIHPPVDVEFFAPPDVMVPLPARHYYYTASRWVPYKRLDLIVDAFRDLPDLRLIVGGDGPDAPAVRAAAPANVEFLGHVSRDRMRDLLLHARGFVFAAREDFGILPVEAQACGTPVLAFGAGGARETVVDGVTGLFFDTQTPQAIADGVRRFEARLAAFDTGACREHALAFSTQRFTEEFTRFVAQARSAFTPDRHDTTNRG
jgi:glycosyltransferase involved in cell wall biosynthesis